MTTVEALHILSSILGVPVEYGFFDDAFVITIDTLMKMLSIQLRVRYGIPVIIMGMLPLLLFLFFYIKYIQKKRGGGGEGLTGIAW